MPYPSVLAREEFFLAAGETRELVLTLAEPPPPPDLVTLGGVISFPDFGGEEDVRLEIYAADEREYPEPRYHSKGDVELTLADLERAGSVGAYRRVREQRGRPGDQRSRHCGALALAARELGRPMPKPVPQTDARQEFRGRS